MFFDRIGADSVGVVWKENSNFWIEISDVLVNYPTNGQDFNEVVREHEDRVIQLRNEINNNKDKTFKSILNPHNRHVIWALFINFVCGFVDPIIPSDMAGDLADIRTYLL